ncbi:hypothetical protein OGATHE_001735 [Ogataea polymorpha]|uniref:Uncharacterized protein n=1 Tax=Ogataea polymorpha TaxID=460523 RepID=A0A9P8TE94_9ASCO|nr:hypothetical protein OGATHE_001735 [Ogataea polymorpha]
MRFGASDDTAAELHLIEVTKTSAWNNGFRVDLSNVVQEAVNVSDCETGVSLGNIKDLVKLLKVLGNVTVRAHVWNMQVTMQQINTSIMLWTSANDGAIEAHVCERFLGGVEQIADNGLSWGILTVVSWVSSWVCSTLSVNVVTSVEKTVLRGLDKPVNGTDDLVDASISEPSLVDLIVLSVLGQTGSGVGSSLQRIFETSADHSGISLVTGVVDGSKLRVRPSSNTRDGKLLQSS